MYINYSIDSCIKEDLVYGYTLKEFQNYISYKKRQIKTTIYILR